MVCGMFQCKVPGAFLKRHNSQLVQLNLLAAMLKDMISFRFNERYCAMFQNFIIMKSK